MASLRELRDGREALEIREAPASLEEAGVGLVGEAVGREDANFDKLGLGLGESGACLDAAEAARDGVVGFFTSVARVEVPEGLEGAASLRAAPVSLEVVPCLQDEALSSGDEEIALGNFVAARRRAVAGLNEDEDAMDGLRDAWGS
jgi:hypothetical protein